MTVFKFKVLQDNEKVIKVSDDLNTIHVLRENGDFVVYKIKQSIDEDFINCDFDVFIITKGIGSFEVIDDAEPEDYLIL